jgi:hypothetical protein
MAPGQQPTREYTNTPNAGSAAEHHPPWSISIEQISSVNQHHNNDFLPVNRVASCTGELGNRYLDGRSRRSVPCANIAFRTWWAMQNRNCQSLHFLHITFEQDREAKTKLTSPVRARLASERALTSASPCDGDRTQQEIEKCIQI